MNRYYVVGLTHRDIMDELQLRMLQRIIRKDIVPKTVNDMDDTVLIYSKNAKGHYATLEYIHESIYRQMSGVCGLKHMDLIEEKDLPKDAAVVFRQNQMAKN